MMEKSFMSIRNTYQGSSVGSQAANEKALFQRCRSRCTSTVAGCNFKNIKNRSNDLFFGLQTAGGVLLGLSGLFDGNMGRMTTGIANSTRNTIWFPLKKYMPSEDVALTVASTLAVGTNVPQLMGSASVYELAAASLVISAYSMKAIPGFGSLGIKAYHKATGKKPVPPPSPFWKAVVKAADSEVMGVETKSLSTQITDTFKSAAVQTMQYGPAALLAARAAMQIADGIVRQDYNAAGAGVAYMTGSVVWFIGACKLDSKKQPAAKKDKPTYPWQTQQA